MNHYKTVDGIEGEREIAGLFSLKYKKLLNTVSYDEQVMTRLQNNIDDSIISECASCTGCDTPYDHNITISEVTNAINKLKHGKGDGSSDISSDHGNVSRLLSILFTMMLRHGVAPYGHGTMVPIPKGRWSNLNVSVNYRAITLSSIVDKILDMVILIREESHILTSDLQFSFKTGSSTTMCTAMIQDTVSCYVCNGSNVNGLLLDATQAFDRLNYCKLFSILLNRDV